MPVGISNRNADPASFLGLARDIILRPGAADADYFSSAADGGSQGNFSIASSVVGDSVFRSASGKHTVMYGRRLTVTKADASGTDLKVTLRVFYWRHGVNKFVDVVCNGAGTETIDSGVLVDELDGNPKIIAISNNTTSDTVSLGYDAKWIGLLNPIRGTTAIRLVQKFTSAAIDASGCKNATDITAAMVDTVGSAVDLNALYATTITANDDFVIEYLIGGNYAGREFFQRKGLRFT